jgi:hypothetical protein
MVSHPAPREGAQPDSYARMAYWQSDVSSEQEVERQAALLAALYGNRQALEEAGARLSSARAYSSRLSADFWERVVLALQQKSKPAGASSF